MKRREEKPCEHTVRSQEENPHKKLTLLDSDLEIL